MRYTLAPLAGDSRCNIWTCKNASKADAVGSDCDLGKFRSLISMWNVKDVIKDVVGCEPSDHLELI